jgi:phage-related minor tail protein
MDMDSSGYVDGVRKADAANEALVSSSKKVDTSQQSTQRTLTQSGRAFTRLVTDLDPALKSQLALEKGQATLASSFERGKITQQEYTRFLDLLTQKHAPLNQALATSRRGMEQYGDAAKLTRFQMLTMQYTFNDVIASLASGGSPLTILMQQGGQVTQAFGGLSGTLSALLTPMRLAVIGFGTLAVGLGAAMSAVNDNERTMRSFEVTLAATGRSALLSRDDIEKLIQTTSKLSGVSRDEATQSVQSMIASRHIGSEMYSSLTELAGNYAAVIGKDVPTAMTELLNGMKNASAFSTEMHDRFGILTFAQYQHIIALEKAGKAYEASHIVFDALAERMDGLREESVTPLTDKMNSLSQAWEDLKKSFTSSGWVQTATGAVLDLATAISVAVRAIGEFDSSDNKISLGRLKEESFIGPREQYGPFLPKRTVLKQAGEQGEGRDLEAMRQAAEKAEREKERRDEEARRKSEQIAKNRVEAKTSLDSMIKGYELESEALTLGGRELAIQQEIRKAQPQLTLLSAKEEEKYTEKLRESKGAAYDELQILKERKRAQDEYNQSVKSFAKSVSRTLADAFVEGKSAAEGFKSFYLDMLKQLAERSILNVIVNPLLNASGLSGGGADGGSMLISIFSSIFGGMQASGGSVYPGHSYVVGEKGRETFVPSTQGTIVPNSGGTTKAEFNFNVVVNGPAASDPATSASAGKAFAVAAEAKIVEIIQRQQRQGGALWGTA